jgi:hypothetical protein
LIEAVNEPHAFSHSFGILVPDLENQVAMRTQRFGQSRHGPVRLIRRKAFCVGLSQLSREYRTSSTAMPHFPASLGISSNVRSCSRRNAPFGKYRV